MKDKYEEMAEELRIEGWDEHSIEKFVRREKEFDDFQKGYGITDLNAYKEFKALPEEVKTIATNTVFCSKCGNTSIKKGFAVRKDKFGLVLEGECSKCGGPVARCLY